MLTWRKHVVCEFFHLGPISYLLPSANSITVDCRSHSFLSVFIVQRLSYILPYILTVECMGKETH